MLLLSVNLFISAEGGVNCERKKGKERTIKVKSVEAFWWFHNLVVSRVPGGAKGSWGPRGLTLCCLLESFKIGKSCA